MPRRELARKSKRSPRAAALRSAGAPEIAPATPQPSPDNQALIGRYLHARDLRPNSRAAYRADLWSFAAAPGPQSLRDVRADDVHTWLRDHTRDPGVPGSTRTWTPSTAARKLATLKAFSAWACETPRAPTYGGPVPGGYSLAAPLTALRFTKLTVGDGHVCGIDTRARLYCWGANAFGQLGHGTTADRQSPTAVALPALTAVPADR